MFFVREYFIIFDFMVYYLLEVNVCGYINIILVKLEVCIECFRSINFVGGIEGMAERYRKSFFNEMVAIRKDLNRDSNPVKAMAYNNLQEYVIGCTYTTYKHAKRVVSMALTGISYAEIAKRIGVSESTIRQHLIVTLSGKLYDVFGSDFFRLFREFDSNESTILKRVYLATREDINRYEVCPEELLNYVADNNDYLANSTYSLEECRAELAVVIKYSKLSLRKDLEKLDPNKLNYVLRVLDGLSGSAEDRYNFIMKLEDKRRED